MNNKNRASRAAWAMTISLLGTPWINASAAVETNQASPSLMQSSYFPGPGGCNGPGFQVVSPFPLRSGREETKRLLMHLPQRCVGNAEVPWQLMDQCNSERTRCKSMSTVQQVEDAQCTELVEDARRQWREPHPAFQPITAPPSPTTDVKTIEPLDGISQ